MTTKYKLNVHLEWTYDDRDKDECPVPAGSDVTVWFADGEVARDCSPQHWDWGKYSDELITAYLIHSVPREPIVRWLVVGGALDGYCYNTKKYAEKVAAEVGVHIVKVVEVME